MNTITRGEWTIHVTPNEGRPTYRVRAIHRTRTRVITDDKLTEGDVASFDPDERWAFGLMKAGVFVNTYNVRMTVVALMPGTSPEDAIGRLRDLLSKHGFEVHDDPAYPHHAFVSEVQAEEWWG